MILETLRCSFQFSFVGFFSTKYIVKVVAKLSLHKMLWKVGI